MIKRIFDTIISFLAVIILSPIFAFISIMVIIKFGWPVFFTQTRPGFKAKPFKIIKFRTMTNEKDENGELLPEELRITPFGMWLRSTSLDELPELFNVLKGEMSLVGPRPLLMEYLPLYNSDQKRRMDLKPGITGWAQVNGRNAIPWPEKFRMDIWYIDNQSFWLDLKIIFLTLKKVISREGISHENEVSMPKFKGNDLSS
ncbi:sugar transferase [Cyclobacteriaceae bacterium YHN15]|jgi:sugar transferase EpsL|nr:sugar transferase [Cyclobacteriaceae bacterium YHN15]